MSEPRFNQEQYKILMLCSEKKDITEWNEWRKTNQGEEIRLEGAGFEEADLRGADLRKADLRKADLRGADLSIANLRGADLFQADLSGAFLFEADLTRADLIGANLSEAFLIEADLIGANLREADLSGANLRGANLFEADLSGANLFEVDLSGADFENALLNECRISSTRMDTANLEHANLTGCVFHHVSTFDWKIEGILCDYIYLDYEKTKRQPEERNFESGEFERLYRSLPTIEYIFENGMKWFDAVIMDQVAQEIQNDNPEAQIQLTAIDSNGIYPRAIFSTLLKENVKEFGKQIAMKYEEKIKYVEADRDRLYQLLLANATAPRKLTTNIAGGDIVQPGRNAIINQISPEILDKIIELVKTEPPESFKKDKSTVIDYLKTLPHDVLHDEAKDSVKGVLDKLKPLVMPVLYTAIKGMLGG